MCIFAPMKVDFLYSTDFLAMNAPELSHTVPILKDYLSDERLSLTQIAELMNFASLSYFSRYCTKHLGQSPSEYRQSLQPK